MKVSVTRLRSDVYNLLDHVTATGEPIEIERKGQRLRIIAVKPPSRLQRLKANKEKLWIGDRRDIFNIDWLAGWRKKWKIKK
jgi:hypothetical protein